MDDGDATWIVDAAGDQVIKVDPEANTVKEIATGDFPVDVVTAAGGAWVSNSRSGTITEIDAGAGEAIGEFPVECPGNLIIAFGSLWVTNSCDDGIRRIDLMGSEVVANISTGAGPSALVEWGGYIWVANSDDDTVVRVDPATNEVIGDPIEVGRSPRWIAAGAGSIWVANERDGTISRIEYEPQPEPDFTPLPTPNPTEQSSGDPCQQLPSWEPTYLPPGFMDGLRPGAGGQLGIPIDEQQPRAIGHFRDREHSAGRAGAFIDVYKWGVYYTLGRDSEPIDVLGGAGRIGPVEDGFSVEFPHEGCRYSVIAFGPSMEQLRKFAGGLIAPDRRACATGPWAKHCPEAGWARAVAAEAGYTLAGDTGSALIIKDANNSFYFWAFEPEQPPRREEVLRRENYVILTSVDGTPVHFDGVRLTWEVHGLWVWLDAGAGEGPPTDETVIAEIVTASERVPYP